MEKLADYGYAYAETRLDQLPVEPFNTFSNLLFLIIAIYWLRQISKYQGDFRRFLQVGIPLLLVGFLGGTIYHATRSHWLWLFMDVAPIYLLGFLTGVYHWKRLIHSIPASLVLMVISFASLWGPLMYLLPEATPHRYTLSYMSMAVPVVLPILIELYRSRFYDATAVFIPLFFISSAFVLRSLDSALFIQEIFPMGTHWLWHLLGALSCHFLLHFMARRAEN